MSRLFSIAVGALLVPAPAFAAVVGINSSAALVPDDIVQWDQFGPPGSVVDTPATWISAGGFDGLIASPSRSLTRVDEGDGWTGGFAPGERLLLQTSGEPVILTFGGLRGFGAQFQPRTAAGYTITINVYGFNNELLGSFSSSSPTNDVQFFGVLSDRPDIEFVELFNDTDNRFADAYAFGPVQLRITAPTPVPEPGTIGLLSLGLIALGTAWRQRASIASSARPSG